MHKSILRAALAALLVGVSSSAVLAEGATPAPLPDAPAFDAQGKVTFVGIADILEYKALPEYHEPDFVKAMVDAGTLPAVKDRLPKEPLVYKTGNMKDGIGVYGDVMSMSSAAVLKAGTTGPASRRAGAASTSVCRNA